MDGVLGPRAELRLATIWTTAPDRRAVAEAANRIDQMLRFDPTGLGESCAQGRRIFIEPPLGVIFRVVPEDRTVYVLTVWHFDHRSKES